MIYYNKLLTIFRVVGLKPASPTNKVTKTQNTHKQNFYSLSLSKRDCIRLYLYCIVCSIQT